MRSYRFLVLILLMISLVVVSIHLTSGDEARSVGALDTNTFIEDRPGTILYDDWGPYEVWVSDKKKNSQNLSAESQFISYDVDMDGADELLFMSLNGTLIVLDVPSGVELLNMTLTEHRVWASCLAVGNLDSDVSKEILVSNRTALICVDFEDGYVLWTNDIELVPYSHRAGGPITLIDPDGDGFEKYLLPYDAVLDDLYSTAIAMEEIKKIFQRIHSDRVIFIADTCYSGASGGRTMLASKTRATLSEKFFERISQGKGRVIISASSANEISKEDDQLKHGIFTYYLLEGLKGKADYDGDGIITLSEVFSFVSRKVPEASGQDQHPVRKGETEGEFVIGRVK